MGLWDEEQQAQDPALPEAHAEPDPAEAGAAQEAAAESAATDPERIDLLDPDAEIPAFRALDHAAQEELLKNPAWKGFKVEAPRELLKGLPIEVNQLLHNTRSQASRAIQAAATERRAAVEERLAAEKERTALAQERAQFQSLLTDPKLLAAAPAEEPDAKTDPVGWLKWAAGKEARAQIEAFQGNLKTRAEQEHAALQAKVEEVQVQAQQAQLAAWIESTPEMQDPKTVDAVEAKLKAVGHAISPQEALDLVLVERARTATGARREAIRNTATLTQRPSGGRRGADIPPTPDSADYAVIQRFYEEWPEAKARDTAARRRPSF